MNLPLFTKSHEFKTMAGRSSQWCVSYALNCGSSDNIATTAAEFSGIPEQGVLLGVLDGHGGKQTSKICKDTVAARCM